MKNNNYPNWLYVITNATNRRIGVKSEFETYEEAREELLNSLIEKYINGEK